MTGSSGGGIRWAGRTAEPSGRADGDRYFTGSSGGCPLHLASRTLTANGGYGILGSSVALTDVRSGARPAVFLAAQWPKPGQQVYAWGHLPEGTSFVTYTWESTQLWERPIGATAAFVTARPAQFDGPMYSDWHTATIPVLRAFDDHGNQLARINAPRITGDDYIISPDAPPK